MASKPGFNATVRHPYVPAVSVAPHTFTSALSHAANSVTIVTTDGTGGRAGLTVSSMCSVCADPPVVLVCVNQDNQFCTAADQNRTFCVNLLTTEQQHIAVDFAGMGKNPDADRFLTGEWTTQLTGAPTLSGALVSLDCELTASYPQGTHVIYIGRVVAVTDTDKFPLVYCKRAFTSISTPPSS